MKKLAITSDCVCDLTDESLEFYDVKIIYFYIGTDHGSFKDRDEITAANVVEYFQNGGRRIKTQAPAVEEFEGFFTKVLQDCDELIHISIGSDVSHSYYNATNAAENFNGRVTVFDSKNLSTGMGHLVIRAAERAVEGMDTETIIAELEEMREIIDTTFIAKNADYLYRTGRVKKIVRDMCDSLKLHPILGVRNGKLKLIGIEVGDYEKSVMRYIKKALRKKNTINTTQVFITHANASMKLVSRAKVQVAKLVRFEAVEVTEVCATVSSNCGKDAIGVVFVRK